MKEIDKRKGLNNKEKSHPARPETRDRKLQGKNNGKNFKEKEIGAKLSDKLNSNTTVGSDLKSGQRPSEAFENVVIDYMDDAFRSEEALHHIKALKTDKRRANEKLSDNSSDMEIVDESDAETTNDSVSSHGDPQTVEEDKLGTGTRGRNRSSGSDGYSQAQRSRSDRSTNNMLSKAPKQTPRKVPEKGISKLAKSSSDNLKNMRVHSKPLLDSSEGADDQPLEQDNGVHFLDDASSGAHTMCSENGTVDSEDHHTLEDKAASDQKIKKMETRIKNLESELREVAALEIAIYSVVPEHGSSAQKVHTPARRLSRLYIYACKYWSQDRRATVARNTLSGLVLVSKSCGNDVSRLTFWLSNAVVLREIIFQSFGSSCHSNAQAKVFKSNGSITKSSTYNRSTNREMNKMGFLQFVDDWQETRTFTAALEKVESWIFSRIVESIWWQTLTPNMQSVGDSITHKGSETVLGPALGDRKQGSFSINLWKNAFHDAFRRLCPVRAGGHECGCLPVLARKVMEQCIGRLDVAMFNAILRESVHEIPTDPVSDPIVDSKVLPIPAGDLSFGSGAQLKNSVGNWGRWLSDFIGMDADGSAKDKNRTLDDDDDDDDDDEQGSKETKCFPLLNALSDLLMLPKDMLMDRTIRMEVCPSISLPLVKRVLCNFSPDEFCPDPVPGAVLEALNAECMIERTASGESTSSFPYAAAPTVYAPPTSSKVAEKVARSQLSRSASSVQRKGYTSDEELDELESCLSSVIDTPSPTGVVRRGGGGGGNARYDLLREVWQST